MQLIFVTIFLLFILLPGIAARLGYLKRDGLITVTGSKFYIEFIFIVFISLFFHFTSWFYFENNSDFKFNLDLFYKLVIGKDIDLKNHTESIFLFTCYNGTLSLVLFGFGIVVNTFLTKRYWSFNSNFSFLEYTGNWDRILSTDISKENRRDLRSGKKSLVLKLAVLTLIGDKSILYKGKLHRYYIDGKGYVDKIILLKADRLELHMQDNEKNDGFAEKKDKDADKEKDSKLQKILDNLVEKKKSEEESKKNTRYTKIDNHHFVIYGSTIQNISIDYELFTNDKSNGTYKGVEYFKNGFAKLKKTIYSIKIRKIRNQDEEEEEVKIEQP